MPINLPTKKTIKKGDFSPALKPIRQTIGMATQALLVCFAFPIASQATPFPLQKTNQPQTINQPSNQLIQAPAQAQPGYILVTPKYARPAMAPDLTFVLPYNFPYNQPSHLGDPGQGFNAAPNQPFIQQFNQFPYQIPIHTPSQAPYSNLLPNQPTNQAPQYATPQFPSPAPLGHNRTIRQN